EDVHVLERLGLRPPRIRPGQEVPIDLESLPQVLANLLLPPACVLLLAVSQLEPTLELVEGLGNCDHNLLQYAVFVPSGFAPIVVPTPCRTNPSVDRRLVDVQPWTSKRPGLVTAMIRYSHPAGSKP